MRVATAIFLMLLLALPAIAEDSSGDGIAWVNSYEEGLALAKKTDRHLLVDFYTPT